MKTKITGQDVAVYAGTFDPITNGHYDILVRAARIFPKLIVAVVQQPNKKTLLSAEERRDLVQSAIDTLPEEFRPRVEAVCFSGLLVDYVRTRSAAVIVRGLRAVSDYEYEAQMAVINRHLSSDIETLFLMSSDHCSFISSSVVREIAVHGGDVSGLVPKPVAEKLKQVYAAKLSASKTASNSASKDS